MNVLVFNLSVLFGVALVSTGAYMLAPPLGFIVCGGLILWITLFLFRMAR